MKIIFSVLYCLLSFFLIVGVYSAARVDNVSFVEVEAQEKMINGQRLTINREGCAEAIGVWRFYSVAGGDGGKDFAELKKLTGKNVEQICCGWWPELNECKVRK